MSLARHDADVDALVTDRYLEALLVALDRRASDVPSDATLDPSVRATARRLSRDLSRVHPSFRFEERLAARLADAAARMRLAGADAVGEVAATAADTGVVRFGDGAVRLDAPTRLTAAAVPSAVDAPTRLTNQATPPAPAASSGLGELPDPAADRFTEPAAAVPSAVDLGPADPDAHPAADVRPYLIGGALTSAALVGAAWLAWRSGHVPVALRSGRATDTQRLG